MVKVSLGTPEEEGRGHQTVGDLIQCSGYTDGHVTFHSWLYPSLLVAVKEGKNCVTRAVGKSSLMVLSTCSAKEAYYYQ